MLGIEKASATESLARRSGWPSILDLADVMFPPSFHGVRRIVMVAGFFDRSTITDDGSPILAVAGYVSTNIQWHHDFDGPWRAALDEAGLLDETGRGSFHMTEYETHQPPYDTWDKAQRVERLQKLHEIIGHTAWLGVGAAVVLKAWDNLSEADQQFLKSPYYLCATWCARLLRLWMEEHNRLEGIAYMFDHGDPGYGEVRAGFEDLIGNKKNHVQSTTVGDKRDYPQLQAADIIAYETAKQTLRTGGLGSRPNPRKSMLALLEKVEHQGEFFDEESLPRFVPKLRTFIDARGGLRDP